MTLLGILIWSLTGISALGILALIGITGLVIYHSFIDPDYL